MINGTAKSELMAFVNTPGEKSSFKIIYLEDKASNMVGLSPVEQKELSDLKAEADRYSAGYIESLMDGLAIYNYLGLMNDKDTTDFLNYLSKSVGVSQTQLSMKYDESIKHRIEHQEWSKHTLYRLHESVRDIQESEEFDWIPEKNRKLVGLAYLLQKKWQLGLTETEEQELASYGNYTIDDLCTSLATCLVIERGRRLSLDDVACYNASGLIRTDSERLYAEKEVSKKLEELNKNNTTLSRSTNPGPRPYPGTSARKRKSTSPGPGPRPGTSARRRKSTSLAEVGKGTAGDALRNPEKADEVVKIMKQEMQAEKEKTGQQI